MPVATSARPAAKVPSLGSVARRRWLVGFTKRLLPVAAVLLLATHRAVAGIRRATTDRTAAELSPRHRRRPEGGQ